MNTKPFRMVGTSGPYGGSQYLASYASLAGAKRGVKGCHADWRSIWVECPGGVTVALRQPAS